MKKTTYAYAKEKLFAKFVLSEVNLTPYHYNQLIDEASKRETGFERRMQIKDELSIIRILRRDVVKPVKKKGIIEEDYTFNDSKLAYICD